MKNKKIAFILYNYPLGVSTMLINTIALLKQDNDVTVFLNDNQLQYIPCESWLSDLCILLPTQWLPKNKFLRFFFMIINKGKRLLLINKFLSWEKKNSQVFRFANKLKKEFSKKNYDILIPVESFSLIAVNAAHDDHANIVYFDMELLDWGTVNPLYHDKIELKKRQHLALQNVRHVMITSPERADLFAEINNFDAHHISVLPVVPIKKAIEKKSSYFRDKFALSNDKVIVIYMGNFMPWAQCIEIINSIDQWPDNAVLIMHTYNRQMLASDYFNKMQKAAYGRPVFFSSEYLLYGELANALTSADVGLLFYESIDFNFTEICFSSNKMSEYVAAGLPIITSPFPSLKNFVEKQGIGKAVPFEKIGDALREILINQESYQQNVKKCADTFFSFEEYFHAAWARYQEHSVH